MAYMDESDAPNFFWDNIQIWKVLSVFLLYTVLQLIYCRGIYSIKKVQYSNNVNEKVIIVTGANSGLGLETVIKLSKLNAKTIIIASRNERKALGAMATIRQEVPQSKTDLVFMRLDLLDLGSIKQFSMKVKEKYPVIDILLNNAGMLNSKIEYSQHGIETNFAANYLGTFYLTNLLLENIKKSKEGRIIMLASVIHEMLNGEIDIDDLFDGEINVFKNMVGYNSYAKAKLCIMYFTKLLAKNLEEQGINNVKVVCLHPGVVNTRFFEGIHDTFPCPGFRCLFFSFCGIQYFWVLHVCIKSPKQGSYTSLACSLIDFKQLQSGAYYCENHPKKPVMKDNWLPDAEHLWARTENLIQKLIK